MIISTHTVTLLCQKGSGCDIVQQSKYAYTFGIKNSTYGTFIFTFLTLITLVHIKKPNKITRFIIDSSIIIGSVVAIYLIYLQTFVIKSFCSDCIVVDMSLLVALVILMTAQKDPIKLQ